MKDYQELSCHTPPFVSMSWRVNADCLPKNHEVQNDACQMANACFQRVLVPVLGNCVAKVVRVILPHEIGHRVKSFVIP
jgi:hypothetical protein